MVNNLNQKLLGYKQMVPRYTSYPTAPQFSDSIGEEKVQSWLQQIDEDAPISLYLHIPYCKKICWYCGCNAKATKQYDPVMDYVDLLLEEIRVKRTFMPRKTKVSHIHFGGGSPSILSAFDFTRVMQELKDQFYIMEGCEIALELDPRSLSEIQVAAYAKEGVNRISLGVQDVNKDVQQSIGRVQPISLLHDAVHLLRDYGIDHISFDLLYGLPGQSLDHIENSITQALALKPNRISFFGYAHVPWMKKHMRLIDSAALPDATARVEAFEYAQKLLRDKAYTMIGLDHFVQKDDSMAIALENGTLHRNFQGYTTDIAPTLIGFGNSAISAVKDGYFQNQPDLHQYKKAIKNGTFAISKGIAISAEDQMRRAVINKLMCYFTADVGKIAADFGFDLHHLAQSMDRLEPLINDGFVTVEDGGVVTVTKECRQAVRLAAAAFDDYLTQEPMRHAQVS